MFGLLGGDTVTRYGVDASVLTPSVWSDAHTAILGLADKLSDLGFLASISSISPGYVYSTFHVTLSKRGNTSFSVNDAKAALNAALTAQSVSSYFRSFVEVPADIVVFVAQAIPTAVSDKGRQQTKDTIKKTIQDDIIPFVANPFCAAIEGATGMKCKTVLVGGALLVGGAFAIIYGGPVFKVVGKVTGMGGLGGSRKRRRKSGVGRSMTKRWG